MEAAATPANTSLESPRLDSPLLVGLKAARANLVPGLIVQAAMVLLVVSYYHSPAVAEAMGKLAAVRVRWGIWFSIATTILAAGLLPEIFTILFFQGGRVTRANWVSLRFGVVYWAYNGIMADLFYRLLAVVFGDQPSVGVVVLKVLSDQLVYTTLLGVPVGVLAFQWHKGTLRGLPWQPARYKADVLPSLVMCWGYWVPMCTIFYCLPSPLQMPVATLMNCFWVMLFTYVNGKKPKAG